MIHIEAPVAYRQINGRRGDIGHTEDWPQPRMRQDGDGSWWVEHTPNGRWQHLGYAPRPTSRWQRFRNHLGHGLMMQYPLPAVVWFALRNLCRRMQTR